MCWDAKMEDDLPGQSTSRSHRCCYCLAQHSGRLGIEGGLVGGEGGLSGSLIVRHYIYIYIYQEINKNIPT